MRYLRMVLAAFIAGTAFIFLYHQPVSAASSFQDVSGHWAEEAIQAAADKGIMNGYPDGTFKPNQPVSRAELLKVLAVALKLDIPSSLSTSGAWYAPYEAALKAEDVYADGDYIGKLTAPSTRHELAALAVRSVLPGYRGQELSREELMFRAVHAGLLSRTGTAPDSIDADGTTTRAQVAVVAARLLKLLDGQTLPVDKGASSAAEVAWHFSNEITMLGQDRTTLPFTAETYDGYKATILQMIIIDPKDATGYYHEYLAGAAYPPQVSSDEGLVFAFKIKGQNLKNNNQVEGLPAIHVGTQSISFANASGVVEVDKPFWQYDDLVSEHEGVFWNKYALSLVQAGSSGFGWYTPIVKKADILAEQKQNGYYNIELQDGNNQSVKFTNTGKLPD